MADKVNGGGGGGYLDQFNSFVDNAVGKASDVAQSAADAVESGAKEVGEGLKELAADGEKLVNDTVDSTKTQYESLKAVGAGAKHVAEQKLDSAISNTWKGVEDTIESLQKPLELATHPKLISKDLQEFFTEPFVEYFSGQYDSLNVDARETITQLATEVSRTTSEVLQKYEPPEVLNELMDSVEYYTDGVKTGDLGISKDAVVGYMSEALGAANEVAKEIVKHTEFFDAAEDVSEMLDSARDEYGTELLVRNPALGVGFNIGTAVWAATFRALGSIDDAAQSLIDNQAALQQALKAMSPSMVTETANMLDVGDSWDLTVGVQASVHEGAGVEGEAAGTLSFKRTSKSPDVFQITVKLNAQAGVGVGVEAQDQGAKGDVTASMGGSFTMEVKGENLEKAVATLMATDVISINDARESLSDVGLRFVQGEGELGAGVKVEGGAILGGAEAAYGVKGTSVVAYDSADNLLVGEKYAFELGVSGEVGASAFGASLNDETGAAGLKTLLKAVPAFDDYPQLGVVIDEAVALVGADTKIKGEVKLTAEVEYLKPPEGGKGEDVYKIGIKGSVALGEGSLELGTSVEIKGLGALVGKDPGLLLVVQDFARGLLDVEDVENRIRQNGADPKALMTVRTQLDYARSDEMGVNVSVAKFGAKRNFAPVTLASLTSIGDASGDVTPEKAVRMVKSKLKSLDERMEAAKSGVPPKAKMAYQLNPEIRIN